MCFASNCLADANDVNDVIIQQGNVDATYGTGYFKNLVVDSNLVYTDGNNVGIGTTEPKAKLEVNGDIIAKDGNSNDWNAAYGWGNHALAGYLTSETDPQVGNNTTNYIPKWDGSELTTGTIYDNGNIGIGTTSPSSKLEVAGNIGCSDPIADNHAATKAYVDNQISGMFSITSYSGNTEVSTSSTSYVNTYATITHTAQTGKKVLILFTGTTQVSYRNSAGEMALFVDGVETISVKFGSPSEWVNSEYFPTNLHYIDTGTGSAKTYLIKIKRDASGGDNWIKLTNSDQLLTAVTLN
jgi:hypothetical protein